MPGKDNKWIDDMLTYLETDPEISRLSHSCTTLVSYGFIRVGPGRIQCSSCDLSIHVSEKRMCCPLKEHRQKSPECQFFKDKEFPDNTEEILDIVMGPDDSESKENQDPQEKEEKPKLSPEDRDLARQFYREAITTCPNGLH